MSLRSSPVDAAPSPARRRRRASLITLVALVALVVGGVALARSPISPVRQWAVHVPAPTVSIALERPDDAPDTFAPGRPLDLPLELRRAGDPPRGDDTVSWQARFVPADGEAPPALDQGSLSVPTGAVVPLPLSVVVDADARGHLVVALDTGASVQVALSPADEQLEGASQGTQGTQGTQSTQGTRGAPSTQEETRG